MYELGWFVLVLVSYVVGYADGRKKERDEAARRALEAQQAYIKLRQQAFSVSRRDL